MPGSLLETKSKTVQLTDLISPLKSLYKRRVSKALPIISLRAKSGSSSQKERRTVTAPPDRPILVLMVSLLRRR
jgi:hypothetical protein